MNKFDIFANKTNAKTSTPPPHCLLVGCNNNHGQRGFTIIEVALVLAIAGLIFLVVFLALPALQNSQKDTARRQDVGRVAAAIQEYESDTNGQLDSSFSSAGSDVFFASESSGTSGFVADVGKLSVVTKFDLEHGVSAEQAGINFIDIYVDRTCAPTGSTTLGVTTGSYAVTTKLSNGSFYCVNAN